MRNKVMTSLTCNNSLQCALMEVIYLRVYLLCVPIMNSDRHLRHARSHLQ
jgi:hypothetical protein